MNMLIPIAATTLLRSSKVSPRLSAFIGGFKAFFPAQP